mgnify:CR=1 FL=1
MFKLPWVTSRYGRGGTHAAALGGTPAVTYEYDLDDDYGVDTTPIVHFDASQNVYNSGTTLATDGQAISGWGSRVGGYTVDQGTGSAQPTFETASSNLNGVPSVIFDGGDWLAKEPLLSAGTLTSPTTLFMVAHVPVTTVVGWYGGEDTDGLGAWNNTAWIASAKWGYHHYTPTGYDSAGPTYATGQWIICWNFDASGTDYFYASHKGAVGKKRYAVSYTTSENPDANLFNFSLTLGARLAGGSPVKVNSEMAEFIIFNETLTAEVDGSDDLTGGETNAVFDYLKAKYDI